MAVALARSGVSVWGAWLCRRLQTQPAPLVVMRARTKRGLSCTLLHNPPNTLCPCLLPATHTPRRPQHVPEAVGLTFGQARSLFPRAVLCGLHDPQVGIGSADGYVRQALHCTAPMPGFSAVLCGLHDPQVGTVTVYGLGMYATHCTVLHHC